MQKERKRDIGKNIDIKKARGTQEKNTERIRKRKEKFTDRKKERER